MAILSTRVQQIGTENAFKIGPYIKRGRGHGPQGRSGATSASPTSRCRRTSAKR